MSELMNANAQGVFRRKLLSTASVLSLLVLVYEGGAARAEDLERPTVWVELGGQLERVNTIQDKFNASFISDPQPLQAFPFGSRRLPEAEHIVPSASYDRSQPLQAQKQPGYDFGGQAKVSFQSEGSDWIFSAAARYGRANGSKHVTQQTARPRWALSPEFYPGVYITPDVVRFSNANADYTQSHAVVDFQVGKDVGLGLFEQSSQSVFSAGIRFAQFVSRSSVHVNAAPNVQIYHSQPYGVFNKYATRFQTYEFSGHSARSFHGIGPSLSWNGSMSIAGNLDTAELSLDWGISGALLFGRQKVRTDHSTKAYDQYYTPGAGTFYPPRLTHYKHATAHNRSRAVTVPNIGAFAGLSARYANARISLGYRADFFFDAMDGGIDQRHTEDVGFNGPFAKISIGLP